MNPNQSTSVYVGNIPYEATESQMHQEFDKVGPVVSFKLMKDPDGNSRGFGFCTYRDAASAQSAVRNMHGHSIDGRVLKVNFADQGRDDAAPPPPVTIADSLAKMKQSLSQLPVQHLHQILTKMKEVVESRPEHARQVLTENPQLAFALLQAQEILGMSLPQEHRDHRASHGHHDSQYSGSHVQRLKPSQQHHYPQGPPSSGRVQLAPVQAQYRQQQQSHPPPQPQMNIPPRVDEGLQQQLLQLARMSHQEIQNSGLPPQQIQQIFQLQAQMQHQQQQYQRQGTW
eukprot:TRINITY_DN18050_c0_g1_i1.p1 TRINITY_DN18050_c0_g1~~TRINITY_DN18050_c0_g1_i1.p1  ORF type:complete len:285 (-),score=32.16 TRINITY_DN18050_c0_g1_i1:344-1198(-)